MPVLSRREVQCPRLSYTISYLTYTLDYTTEVFKTLDDLQKMPYDESYKRVKELDQNIKDIIIKKLHDAKATKKMGVRTTNKARGQDFRHTADGVMDNVS